MKIIGKENIISEVNKIVEKSSEEDKTTLQELVFYYTCDERDISFLQEQLEREREKHQALVIKNMKEAFAETRKELFEQV